MATVELTTENFEATLTANETVIIDFWADWCGPCKMFAPTYETVSANFPNIVFGKVDTEAQQALAASFNIMSIPTLMIVKEQVVIFSQAGALPEAAFTDIVKQVQNLDMAPIHAEIAAKNADAE
jgi:thioredoxin 1